MKHIIYKIAIVVLLSFFAYTALNVAEQKEASAICIPCAVDLPEGPQLIKSLVTMGVEVVGEFAMSIKNMFESQVETKQQELEELEGTLRELSAQKIGENVAISGAEADLQTAKLEIDSTFDKQKIVYEATQNFPKPSAAVCADTTIKIALAEIEPQVALKKAAIKDRMRKKTHNTSGSLGAKGPIVASVALKAAVAQFCSGDEHRDNAGEFCAQPTSDADISEMAAIIASDGAITPDQAVLAELLQELGYDISSNPVLPKSAITDDVTLAIAGNNAKKSIILDASAEAVAERTILETCEQASKNFVTQVSMDRYGVSDHWKLNGACPPKAVLKAARVANGTSAKNLMETSTSEPGNTRMIAFAAEILAVEQAYESVTELRKGLLVQALGHIENYAQ